MKEFILCLLACVLAHGKDLRWENSYDNMLHFSCPHKQSISYIRSIHSNPHEDRLWDFSCQDTFTTDPECYWTEYTNYFDERLSFICPSNAVITGMSSYHQNSYEDRRWKFQCCRVNNVCNKHCQWTPYVNFFDEEISWTVPYQHYLVGAESYHENSYEDRRWKYHHCTRIDC